MARYCGEIEQAEQGKGRMEDPKHVVIAELSRCVACYTRLHILRLAMRTDVITPKKLAEDLALSVPAAALHLRQLRRNGLFSDTLVANRHEYSLLTGKTEDLQGEMLQLLRNALAKQSFDEGPPAKAITLFSAATGFTYSRRISILKQLDARKQSIPDLASILKLPRESVLRHVNKLESRGYLKSEQLLGLRVYETAAPSSAIHRRYAEIVSKAW